MTADFGNYLRSIRIARDIRVSELAELLSLNPQTVSNTESGYNSPPNPERLRLWLDALGESKRYKEALNLLRQFKFQRTIRYHPRDPANEHIDRLIDAYESGRLTPADIRLLQLVSPQEYS